MKKNIAILGSTGSIGKSLLKIIKKNKKNFNILLLSANRNYKELYKQSKIFNVKNVVITNIKSYEKFKKINKNRKIKVYKDFDKLDKIFTKRSDYTMSAIVGLEGLIPTIKIIKYSKKIAIANKESIICGWNLIKDKLKKYKTKFIPVDSEHFSIWYAMNNSNLKKINKIYLTASGGPLLNFSKKKIKNINIKDVLNHPNWSMGKKITVDSSTMMNKVFEIIEAKNIFDINYNKLNIIIHPQSYIHAILFFNDGMINVVAHETTMEIPIFNSLYENGIYEKKISNLKINKLNNLSLKKIDKEKFPVIKILNYLPNKISLFETVLVSANDELVRLYLNKKIKYYEIAKKLLKIISKKEYLNLKKKTPKNVKDIINLDQYVRLKIRTKRV